MGPTFFRFRMVMMATIVVIGFWAPWVRFAGIGSSITLLEWLALEISRAGLLSFTVATPVVIVCGAIIAALGAWLRIWGSAWLGFGTVIDGQMQGGAITADGPYRYVRNPLYLGMILWVAALTLLMPASGALFTLIAVPLVILGLIRGEEKFLSSQAGSAYQSYLRAVPRLFPRLRSAVAPSNNQPRWVPAILSEILPIGVFITIAAFSWTYNNRLMIRCVLIAFGLSLVLRALMPRSVDPSGLSPDASSPQ
jgi:protein-S-isoprenylcysteine O-methyltransferase Ste14